MADRIDVEKLIASVDLVALIGSFIALKKAGGEFTALCPFHGEQSPSFTVIPAKGFAHCFGCGWNGDAIDFIRTVEGLDFKGACERLGAKTDWKPNFIPIPQSPVIERVTSKPPADTPAPDMTLRQLGKPTMTWTYRDEAGDPLGYVARYDVGANGSRKKEIRCWTWGRRGEDAEGWACGHWSKPRPLYGLDRMATSPKMQVMVHEGEKAADAGAQLFPDQVHITWPGGAHGLRGKVDLEPLRGRASVVLLPDADESGRACMEWLGVELQAMGCVVKKIDSSAQPDGWDIADAVAEGWTQEQALKWAKEHLTLVGPVDAKTLPHPEPADHPDDPGPGYEPPYSDASQEWRPTPEPGSAAQLDQVSGILYRRVADVPARNVNWLWPRRIAKGKFSVIVGNPGLGKSQVTASLTSVVTRGGLWPVDRTKADVGNVIIMSAEDDAEDTIRPRLEAAGADLDRVFLLQAVKVEGDRQDQIRGFNLQADTSKLGALLATIGQVALVVIDPISAYLGQADSHNNAEVRALLAPLVEMAGIHGTAILGVSHLTKSQGMDALLRLQGSVAFSAAARAVWGVAKDKDNPQRRLFMPLKNNLGTDDTGFAYSVESFTLEGTDPPITTSHVMWERELITASAEDVFASSNLSSEERTEVDDAKDFLRGLLSDGQIESTDVLRQARQAGHAEKTLRRAAKALGVDPERERGHGSKGKWYWRLPISQRREPYRDD